MNTISFSGSALTQKLALASKVINGKNVIPAFNNFRIETCENDFIKVTASDGELWLVTSVKGAKVDEGLVFSIDAKQFMSAVTPLGERYITMEVDKETNTANLKYANGHITLPIMGGEDYPMPAVETEGATNKAMTCAQLQNAIGRTSFCVANDEIRMVMNGVHFDFLEDGLVCAATNGRKLIRYTQKNLKSQNVNAPQEFIMPTKVCNVLLTCLGLQEADNLVSLQFTQKNIQVAGIDFMLTARLIEGHFPNYNAVIPSETAINVEFDKKEFVETLRHVMPLGNQENQLVALKFEESKVTVYAEDISYNCGAYETLQCAYASQEQFLIGFNGSILMQLVQNTQGDKFILAMNDERKAALVLEAAPNDEYECIGLVMPMLVNL